MRDGERNGFVRHVEPASGVLHAVWRTKLPPLELPPLSLGVALHACGTPSSSCALPSAGKQHNAAGHWAPANAGGGAPQPPKALKLPTWGLAAMLMWSGGAIAQSEVDRATPPPQCAVQPAQTQTPLAAQQHFAHLEAQCLRSAAYYRHYGQWLLQQRSFGAAIEALERALLLDPDHLGTQLDYAQALLATGDTASALNLFAALRTTPELPAHLADLLDHQLQLARPQAATDLLKAQPENGLYSRVTLSQSIGGDSNLNNATTATNVTLTYPDQDLSFALAPAFRPQAGTTATTAVQWTGFLPQERQAWLFQVEGRTRHTASSATRYQQLEAHATWLQDPLAPSQWIGRAERTQLHWGGRKLYSSHRLGAQHQWAQTWLDAGCRFAAGIEAEARDFAGNRILDGRYQGALLTLVCQKQDGINIQLRAGQDTPHSPERAGGAQRQTELRVQWQTKEGAYSIQSEYALQHQLDAEGYSPLLSRNARRQVVRHAVRLEASRPLDLPAFGSPQWFGSLEYTVQRSNLQAFVSSRYAAQTGLRWTWP